MSQNNLTPKQKAEIIAFFDKEIGVSSFVADMRKLLYTTAFNYISQDPDTFPREIEGGYYWLTEFVEILDPTMDD